MMSKVTIPAAEYDKLKSLEIKIKKAIIKIDKMIEESRTPEEPMSLSIALLLSQKNALEVVLTFNGRVINYED